MQDNDTKVANGDCSPVAIIPLQVTSGRNPKPNTLQIHQKEDGSVSIQTLQPFVIAPRASNAIELHFGGGK